MVNKRPINISIFRSMFHRRDRVEEDVPVSWEHLVEHLIREVQQERDAYYGLDGSEEERTYPGLDYTNLRIRERLVRQPFHAKLYNAFDVLGLSDIEVNNVVTWWGSQHDRTKYEHLVGYGVRDTTEDDIPTEEELSKKELAEEEERRRQKIWALEYPRQRPTLESILKSADTSDFLAFMQASGTSPLPNYSTRRPYPTLPYHH